MLENKINYLIKYVGIVFVFVLCFSLKKTNCFADAPAPSEYTYYIDFESATFGHSYFYINNYNNEHSFYLVELPVYPFFDVVGIRLSGNSYFAVWRSLGGGSLQGNNVYLGNESSYYPGYYHFQTWSLRSLNPTEIYSTNLPLLPQGEYKEDLFSFTPSVFYADALNIEYANLSIENWVEPIDNPIDHFVFTIKGNLGEYSYTWSRDEFVIGSTNLVRNKTFRPAICNDDGRCWWTIRAYDSSGNWGKTYGGCLNFNEPLGIVEGTSDFVFPGVNIGSNSIPIQGIQTSNTYVIPENSGSDISSVINNVINNNNPINTNKYYSYDLSQYDENTTNEIFESILTNNINEVENNNYELIVRPIETESPILEKIHYGIGWILIKLQEIKEEIVSLGKKVGKGDRPDINILPPIDIDIGPVDIDIQPGTNPFNPDPEGEEDEKLNLLDLGYIILLALFIFELLGDVLILIAKFLHWIVHIFNIPASTALILEAENGQHFIDAITVIKGGTALGLEEPITIFGMSLFSFMVIIFQLALIGTLIAFVRKYATDIELPNN